MRMLPTGIELRHFRYFVAASDLGSFRKAGAALSVRESTISRQIKHLEDRIGRTLFHRYHGGVFLTATGQSLIGHARLILRNVSQLGNELWTEDRSAESIRIATTASLNSGPIRDFLLRHFSSLECKRVEILECSIVKYPELIRRDLLDIAFVANAPDDMGLKSEVVWLERIFIAVASGSALSKKPQLSLAEICSETIIVSSFKSDDALYEYVFGSRRPTYHTPHIRALAVGQEKLLAFVAMQKGIVLITESATAAVYPGVAYVPVAVDPIPFCAIWCEKNSDACFRDLISTVRRLAGAYTPMASTSAPC